MKYEIKNERLMKVMEKYMKENIGDIERKLKMVRHKRSGNSGYGSSMHDYTYYNDEYVTEDGETLFQHFDDRNTFSDICWFVNEKLQGLYDFFGEENFEDFVMWYFGFDIKNKRNRENNWLFA